MNGCSTSASVTLTEPTPLSATLTAATKPSGHHVSCTKGEDGEIDLTVSGGIPPYRFNWSSGQFTEDVTGLKAGYHEVHIRDANGAELAIGETLMEPDPIDVGLSSPLYPNEYNVSCHSCYNGTVNSTVSGGAGGYQYFWEGPSGPAGSTANLSSAGEKEYNLTVIDANGCKGGAEIPLKLPERDDWTMSGNAGIGPDQFIGTTDANDLVLKVNNQPQLRLRADGTTEIMQQLRLSGLSEAQVDNSWQANQMLLLQPNGTVVTAAAPPPPPPDDPFPIWPDDVVQPACAQSSTGGFIEDWTYAPDKIYVQCPFVNVGIGTNSPAAKLDVRGQTYSSSLSVNTFESPARFTVRSGGTQNAIEVQTADETACFRVLANGSTVVGKDLTEAGDQAAIYFGNEDHRITAEWGEGLSFSTFGADNALVIEEGTGKVIIGGQTIVSGPHADSRFSVDGKLVAKEIVVTTDASYWADFVFADDYELRSLSEVEMFIEKNGHLPDVPSASEVKAVGQDLGEMNATILRKIEELTLYVIELEKKLNEK